MCSRPYLVIVIVVIIAQVSMHPDYPFKDELPQGYVLRKAPTITSSGN